MKNGYTLLNYLHNYYSIFILHCQYKKKPSELRASGFFEENHMKKGIIWFFWLSIVSSVSEKNFSTFLPSAGLSRAIISLN